ncbi:MAG TPA: DUF488 domain-containing protein [Vicinamibacteria bacterium]|nr:DUF488 domain-containing protein [Vicinamibacteria bacterium]
MTSAGPSSKACATIIAYTIGHSTRAIDELVDLLKENGIRLLVDVRRFPGSRRYPHFGREALAAALGKSGIGYRHEPDLGGRREPAPRSPNTAWRVAGFRGYADHMATTVFQDALGRVKAAAARQPTAVLCAEALPWRCHRQLVADALVADGFEVRHIMGRGQVQPHALHPAAQRTLAGHLVYPGKGR